MSALAEAVELPVTMDFASGFAPDPSGVAESVRRAIGTGVDGISIEDRDLERSGQYSVGMALERLRAARAAIDESTELKSWSPGWKAC